MRLEHAAFAMQRTRHDQSCGDELQCAQLEQRILMSASPAAMVEMPADASQDAAASVVDVAEEVIFSQAAVESDQQTNAQANDSSLQATVELVVIDPSASNYEQLVADLESQTDRNFEILVLNPREDGISQISDALAEIRDVSAVHVVSHGDQGEVLLGASVLNQRTLDRYAAELVGWQHSLTADADILFYGCDFAGSSSGEELVQSLSTLTGADVAASTDDTGHAILGGDWELESTVGQIETDVAFSEAAQQNWVGILSLDAIYFSTNNDVTSAGTPGLDTWGRDDVVQLGNPNLSLGTATTTGTVAAVFDLDSLVDDGDASLDALHYVSTNLTVGSANAVNLQVGDILFSTAQDEALEGGAFTLEGEDVGLFRPDTPGDYSSGTFSILLDELSIKTGAFLGPHVNGLSLVEQTTTVGDVTLNAGDFIYTNLNDWEADDIMLFETADVGAGTTAGTRSKLLNGTDIGFSATAFLMGLDLVEAETVVGGETLAAGTILLQSTGNQSNVGTSNISTTPYDVMAVSFTDTTLGSGTAVADASILLRGDDVGLDASDESINALSLGVAVAANTDPVITSNGGGASAAVNVQENTTTVTTVTATDSGAPPQTLTYSISGGADQLLFSIDNVSGVLAFAAAPDFEAPTDAGTDNVYNVQVQVSDGVGGVDVQDLAVTVTDTAVLAYESFSYGSGSLDGANGGSGWATAWNTTAGSSAVVAAAGLNDPSGLLPVQGGTAEMDTSSQFTQTRDLATTLGADGTTAWFSFLLKPDGVASGGMSLILGDGAGAKDTVTVGTNSNDFLITRNATTTGASYVNNVLVDAQTYFLAVKVDFHDGDDTITLYVDPTPGEINPDSPGPMTAQLSIADLGTFTEIGLIGGFAGNNTNIDEIRVGDEFIDVAPSGGNTAPTINSNGGGTSAAINVAENTSVVTTVTATDPETPPQTLTYTISGGADQLLFNIDSVSGALSFSAVPDYEAPADSGADNIYNVQVQVSDGVGGTDTQNITVAVDPVNDNLPVVTAAQAFNVAESAANGTSVGVVAATDDDAGTTFSNWTITGGNTDGVFEIVAATGELRILDNTNLDYETTTSYTLSLTVSDGSNTSAVETVSVSITPVNDNTPVITAAQSFSIAESASNGASLGTVAATDDDAGTTFSNWTITGGNTGGVFEIVAATGELRILDNTNLDYEFTTSYTLSLTVSDGTNTSAVETVTVSVTPVNDNSPAITAAQSFSVAEAAANGVSVGTVAATDNDAGTTLHSWTIVSGNTGGVFEIVAGTGELRVLDNTSLDFATTPSYTLGLTVSDGVHTSAVQTVTVNVTQNNVAPVVVGETYTVAEGGAAGESVVAGWYNPSWKHRQQIVFDNSGQAADLLNHAVLVKLHSSAGDAINVDYLNIQDAGEDLRFVDSDGSLLNHEIELWDESGYSYVWVEVPQIDGGSDTDFVWMYSNNASAIDGQAAAAVWESDDVAVLHMNSTALDSSVHDNDGFQSNVVIANGISGGAGDWNGVNSYITLGSDASIDDIFSGGGTVSAWIHADSLGENDHGGIADKATSTFGAASNGDGWAFQVGVNGTLIFEHGFTGSQGVWKTNNGSLTLNAWHHVAVVYDNSSAGNDPLLYIDGVLQAMTETTTPVGTFRSDAAVNLVIGNHAQATTRTFDGRIDEFRISTSAANADEIAAHAAAVNGTFVSAGTAGSGPGGLLQNDYDQNADSLSVSLVTGPAHSASFTLNSDGSFNYVHDGSETTTDSFVYRVSDGFSSTDATVTLNITPVNDSALL